jgi:hypothetical protein
MTRALLALVVLGSLAACDSQDEPLPATTVVDQQPQGPSDEEMRPRRPPPIPTGAFSADPNNPNAAPGGWTPTTPAGRL